MDKIDALLEEIYTKADWDMIPEHMHEGLKDYIEYGYQPGGFLTSMLSRDIFDAVWRADRQNEGAIADWVKFLEWYVPHECHGSEEKVRDWIARGGYRGKDGRGFVVEEISTYG